MRNALLIATCLLPLLGGTTAEGRAFAVSCPADLDGDGIVGFIDLVGVLSTWGPCTGCGADLTGDDLVGFDDVLVVLSSWGPCPPEPVGACCVPVAPGVITCVEMTESECDAVGSFLGPGTHCIPPPPPPPPLGACCIGAGCLLTNSEQCFAMGGIFVGSSCGPCGCP